MRILFLGDVVGRSGRAAITQHLDTIKSEFRLDFVIVNGENATGGMGLSGDHAKAILDAGADCITLGDHAFDQKDMLSFIEQEPRIIRPINFSKQAPGMGARLFDAPSGKRVFVAQVLGQVFMKRPYSDPFSAIDDAIKKAPLKARADAIIIDVHAEATSEKMALGHWLDGRASLVTGTHTHVPTADTQIMPKGTAYQTDAGMCGVYNSVIGMDKEEPLHRFITGMRKARFTPAEGEATLCGTFVETNNTTGLAKTVQTFRLGGQLSKCVPT